MIAHHAGVQQTLELVGKRWVPAILYALQGGEQHFNRLMEIPGISDRMLTDRLQLLIREGYVDRIVDPGTPIRVTYRLTERGVDLRPILDAAAWVSA